jgi:hypothetical protein
MEATMGYYSTFEVVDTDIPDIKDVLNNADKQYGWGSPGWEDYEGQVSGYDCAKWYDWLTDLQQLAYAYPNNFLIVLRHGEESPDMSRVIVRDGTAVEQYPNISWPE